MNLSWSFQDKSSKAQYATLTLSDGTVLSVSKSESSTVITLSTSDGLVIDFLPDKKICQRITGVDNIYKGVSEAEIGRAIHADVILVDLFSRVLLSAI